MAVLTLTYANFLDEGNKVPINMWTKCKIQFEFKNLLEMRKNWK